MNYEISAGLDKSTLYSLKSDCHIVTNVVFESQHDHWSWFRQTPQGDGRWETTQVVRRETGSANEWLVVYDDPNPGFATAIPKRRRILFVTEPPSIKIYNKRYLNQFGIVVSPIPLPEFGGQLIQRHSALPWFYGNDTSANSDPAAGTMGWNELLADKPKTGLLSVICSRKTMNAQHVMRLAFVERLKEQMGDQVDVFGRGFRTLGDKAQGVGPYKYHIALENNLLDHFWTEKLADAWLGDSFPIYSGCQNVADYFDAKSFFPIDIRQPDQAIANIRALIGSNVWESRRDAIRESRRRVMVEYNFFAEVHRIVSSAPDEHHALLPPAKMQRLWPSNSFGFGNTIRRIAKPAKNFIARNWLVK